MSTTGLPGLNEKAAGFDEKAVIAEVGRVDLQRLRQLAAAEAPAQGEPLCTDFSTPLAPLSPVCGMRRQ